MMTIELGNDFYKEVELFKKAAQTKKIFWIISPCSYENSTNFCIQLTEKKIYDIEMGEFLFSFTENINKIKNKQKWFQSDLEENYLHETYPLYSSDDEDDEDEDDEKFPIPRNKKQEFFEAAEYDYYIEFAKALIKRIQEYLEKPENEKIYVVDKHNRLLVSYVEEFEPTEKSCWEKEYEYLIQRFEILKAKLDICSGRAIDTYDQLSEEDLQFLDKLYHTHEINSTILLGKYYVLLDNVLGYYANSDGKLKENTIFIQHKEENCLVIKRKVDEKNRIYAAVWDYNGAHKIREYDSSDDGLGTFPRWVLSEIEKLTAAFL